MTSLTSLYDVTKVAKASSAAEGLCCWVRAMEVYDRVAKVVAPKKEALKIKIKDVELLMATLKTKQLELKTVQDKLAGLTAAFEAKTKEKEDLEAQVNLCATKLQRATQLIGGLGGEKKRWSDAAASLQVSYNNVTGDILISSGVIAYLGCFTSLFRQDCISAWVQKCKEMKLSCSMDFNLAQILGDPVKVRQWHLIPELTSQIRH